MTTSHTEARSILKQIKVLLTFIALTIDRKENNKLEKKSVIRIIGEY